MVKNEDVRQEFDLFGDIWKMFKSLLPVGNKDDVGYWDKAIDYTTGIMQQYPGEFGKALAFAVLDELDRRSRENEDQNTGCKTTS